MAAFCASKPDWRPRAMHEGLQLASSAPLLEAKRTVCPRCERSNAYYCCECLLPLTPGVPTVRLPFEALITHAQQNLSSATGVHLALLAPSQVRLLSVDELPQLDASTSAVLFPDDEAVAAEDVDVASITNVIVVDSKWGQARGVVASDKLRGMRHVRLRSYLTAYWRYHTAGVPPDGLCTVEAVFFLCRELHARVHSGDCHCFDDLLWYFAHQHTRTQEAKQHLQSASQTLD